MYCAMADLAYENNDAKMLEVCERLYYNIVNRRMYTTGSIGSAKFGERFTCDYDLPNDTNYSETCASVGLIMFCQRMLRCTHNAKYADTLEKTLYNTVLAGVSTDGTKFFYVNPLEVWPESCENNPTKNHVKTERQKWFGCSCYLPNVARTLASLGQYICFVSKDTAYVNLFISNKAALKFGKADFTIEQTTEYPFGNMVDISVDGKQGTAFTLAVRVPEWSKDVDLKIDGEDFVVKEHLKNGYVILHANGNRTG